MQENNQRKLINHFKYSRADRDVLRTQFIQDVTIIKITENIINWKIFGIIIVHYCWCYIVSSNLRSTIESTTFKSVELAWH